LTAAARSRKQSIAEALKRYDEKISYRSDKHPPFGYTTYDI